MSKPDRIPCLVPFCGRTAPRSAYPAGTVIVCGHHWRMADKRLRRVYMKRQKRGEDEAAARLWSRMLDQIIIRGSMDIERGALRRASG